jgi:hypothetical protein
MCAAYGSDIRYRVTLTMERCTWYATFEVIPNDAPPFTFTPAKVRDLDDDKRLVAALT